MFKCLLAASVIVAFAGSGSAETIDNTRQVWTQPTVFDLPLGAPASTLPQDGYMQYACGTGGGPPSRLIDGWTDFSVCPAEQSGLHEVYFRYDDEAEYWARANDQPSKLLLFEGTKVYDHPVIASGLFSSDGQLRGIRTVSDPRAPIDQRQNAVALRNFLMARYDVDGWQCKDLPADAGETPFGSIFIKQDCTKLDRDRNLKLVLNARHLRKAGEVATDRWTGVATTGQFESSVWFETALLDPTKPARVDNDEEPAAPAAAAPTFPAGSREAAFVSGASNECARCNLQGAQLKRRDLTNASLSGANLNGANLHEAKLIRADLSNADLSDADINNAQLTQAILTGAKLPRAMLYGTQLDGANMNGAALPQAKLGMAKMTHVELNGIDLSGADLRGSRIIDSSMRDANLGGVRLDHAQINRSDLSNDVLSEAIMTGASFRESNLSGITAQHTDFMQADLTDASLTNANLSGSRLWLATVIRTNLDGTILTKVMMPDGKIHD